MDTTRDIDGTGVRRRRGVARVVGVAVVAVAAVALPVTTLPTAQAHPVAPRIERHQVEGRIDRTALADPTALRTASGHARGTGKVVLPRSLRSAVPDAASATPAAKGDGELAVLGAKTSTQHFLVGGVTWAPGSEDVVEADARVLEDGTWSDWFVLDVDDVGVSGERPGTDPIVTGGADGVQVRVSTADGVAPADLRIDVVDPGTSAADATVGAGEAPATPASSAAAANGYEIKPSVVTRAQWGADESRGNAWPEVSSKLQAMYVHHTAGTNTYTRSQSAAIVRGVYAFHTGSRGWPDIGYQFLVDKFGTIYQGRRDAIYDNPIGAQAGGYNSGTIGVSAMGNYDTAQPSAALVAGIEKVLAWKGYEYGVNSLGTTRLLTGGSTGSLTKAKAGTWVTEPTILGHRDTNGTACPGKYLYAKLHTIRLAVHAKLAAARARYGAVRYTTASPTIVRPASNAAPVQWYGSVTYTWKAVKGAAVYQVLTRSASLGGDVSDTRSWKVSATTASTHFTFSTPAGWSRVVAIRPVDSAHRRGPITLHTRMSRPVSTSVIHWSDSWKKVTGQYYFGDKVWTTSSSTAAAKVYGVRDARQVVVKAAVGPGYGKLKVVIGGITCGYLNLESSTFHHQATVRITMKQPHSGTAVLQGVDRKPKSLTTVAFPRS